jgi:MFS family permease
MRLFWCSDIVYADSVIAYLLCITALQPSFGKVYTYFDVKWTFVAALAVFEAGSIICAAATSSKMLIVGRAIAGSGGAGLYSGGMTMLAYAIPLKKRTIYLACLSSMFGIASIVGPILGGVFTDQLTWRCKSNLGICWMPWLTVASFRVLLGQLAIWGSNNRYCFRLFQESQARL